MKEDPDSMILDWLMKVIITHSEGLSLVAQSLNQVNDKLDELLKTLQQAQGDGK